MIGFMKRLSKRVSFDNGRGERLAGIMDWPVTESPRAFATFSHCFTCGKDLKANVHIARRLAEHGFCVLRYDFTGIGESQGDFSQTNFTTNCDDLRAAVAFLTREFSPPQLLVGHSMGGTATAVTANEFDSVRAVATLASPGSTHRLAGVLVQSNPEIAATGEGIVKIGGTDYTIRRQLLEDLRARDIEAELAALRLPILMLHSPDDETLPYGWGLKMFDAVQSPKSFVSLDGANHLLTRRAGEPKYVADLIHHWSSRYLP